MTHEPPLGDRDPVAVPPDAREDVEVRLAVAGRRRGRSRSRPACDGIGAVMTSSPSSPITGWPAGSNASTLAPRQRQAISPSYTGSSGDGADEAGAHVGAAGDRLQLHRRRAPPRTPSGSPPAAAARRSSRRPRSRGQVGQLARHDARPCGRPAGTAPRCRSRSSRTSRPAATAAPRSGAPGLPSNSTIAAPTAGAETRKFHIIQPVVVNQKNRSPGPEVVVQGEHLEVLEQDAAVTVHDRLRQPGRAGGVEHVQRVVERHRVERERLVGGRGELRPAHRAGRRRHRTSR